MNNFLKKNISVFPTITYFIILESLNYPTVHGVRKKKEGRC